jgi:hypothetical protein
VARGARGALCIRPEKVDMVAADASGALPATITTAMRTAGMMEYAVRLPSGTVLTVQEQLRHGIAARAEGSTVGVLLRGEDLRFLPDRAAAPP